MIRGAVRPSGRRRLYHRGRSLRYMLLPLAALLLATLACSFGGPAAPAPRWRYTVPDVWQDSSTYTQVDGPRVYLAPKLPPVYDKATQITQAPETHILTALELATGQRLWSQTVEVKFGADWVAADGRIVFIQPVTADAAAQTIIALDGATGQEVWRFADMQVDDYLLQRGECLFIFDTAGDLLCLDVASGRVLGTYPPVPTAELGEAGADGVQTRITDDAFYRLSPAGVLRVYDLPQPSLTYSVTLPLTGPPLGLDIAADRAFVFTFDEEQQRPGVQVFALPSGAEQWTADNVDELLDVVELDSQAYALLAWPDDGVAAAGLYVFDLATGELLYGVYALNQAYWVSPTGRLITYPVSGKVAALYLPTGGEVWRADSDSDGIVTIDGRGEAVYLVASNTPFMSVGSDVDRFEVYDVASGALRWRLKQGVEALTVPGAAAVLLGNAGELALYPLE